MITGINEEDSVKAILSFLKSDPHIEVYEHVRRGLNGEVYFGRRKKMGDEVVLKFYEAQSNYDSTEEAVILKNIQHDNILKIDDLRFVPPHYAYFLTPKISGGDLQGILDKGSLPTKITLNIIAGILKGLTELHSKHKLVHRDLKLGNILLDLNNYQPIIADLGAVKKIGNDTNFTTASKSTFLYLPPEAVLNNEYYFQSDIYQVGVMMFQLLGGNFPIDDPTKWLTAKELKEHDAIRNAENRSKRLHEMIGNKITKGRITDMDSLPFYLDPIFKRVLKSAVHIQHSKRYLNTAMFLKEIHQLQRNCPDYIEDGDNLIVKHDNGKEFRIYVNNKTQFVLEKKIGTDWRKDNGHDGTMASILTSARRK